MTETSFFSHPGVFLAWGCRSGFEIGGTIEDVVARIADSGFKWIAQEIGDPVTEPTADELTRLRNACRVHGLYFGIWEVKPRTLDRLVAIRPNFWILNVESDHFDYGPLLRSFRVARPKLPAAVITNCDLDPAPFIAANVKAIPEAYEVDNPVATPENMVDRCRGLGWRVVFPCFGVFHGYELARYVRAGNGWSVYLAEEMSAADFDTAKLWNGRR